jgi:MoaA/NifB/PqqE/SkfB family radical SAM enzyme
MKKTSYSKFKIVWHEEKLKSLLEEKVTPPIYVRVKPTNNCNHQCFYCSYDPEFGYVLSERFNRKDRIPKEKMMEILEDFEEMGVRAVTFSGGGEPLIYPYIEDALERTLENGIDLSVITNGQELRGKKLEFLKYAKWIRVSLDSVDPKTFQETRRVPQRRYAELIDNIGNFARIKNDSCELGINFVVNDKNHNQVFRAAKLFKDLGVNHLKITPLYTPKGFFEYHKPLKKETERQIKLAREALAGPHFEVYDTYENDFVLTSRNKRNYPSCPIMQIVPVIGADSCVYTCHDKAYTSQGLLGSLRDQSFKDLWFSSETERIFQSFNPKKNCKHHCTYDSRNILIRNILESFGDHVNFI